jgi:hypothetical protein
MNQHNSVLFFGIFFIFLGLSILLGVLFGINIPVGRIFWGFSLCYLGYYCIAGHHNSRKIWHSYHKCNACNSTTMDSLIIELTEDTFKTNDPFEYTTTLGSTIIDMTHLYQTEDLPKIKHKVIIDTTLGSTTIKINKNYKFCIHTHGTLGHITLPNGQHCAPRAHLFCHPEDGTDFDLEIHAHTVLGGLDIILV